MTTSACRALFVLLCTLVWSVTAQAAGALQPLLEKILRDEGIVGGVLLVSGPDGREIVTAGYADLRRKVPVQPDTRFYVASAGKMVVASAVMQMAGEGRFRLTDRAAPLTGIPSLRKLANAERATVENLLMHTSGLPEYLYGFDEVAGETPDRVWRADEAIAFAYGVEPESARGEFDYCNSNYVLLGRIVEQTDGSDLGTALANRVFRRAGMNNSSVGADPTDPKLAHGYVEEDGKRQDYSRIAWASRLGDGPLVTTAEDLERFIDALLIEKRLLPKPVLELMLSSEGGQEYGHGIQTIETKWGPKIGHSGTYGGFAAEAWHFAERKTTIVLLLNGDQSTDRSLEEVVAKRVFQ